MRSKTIILCATILFLGNYSAHADDNESGPRFTPRPEISQNNYTSENRAEDRMDIKSYTEYEQREQCQHYRKPPRDYADGCVDTLMEEEIIVAVAPKTVSQKVVLPIVSSYTVLFDFDKSDIRNNEKATLNQIAKEIHKYHPKLVTVTGYTDSSGMENYNQTLSSEREQAVSTVLLTRGVMSQTLDHEARGEFEQAIETADGVKNQENRRVVIDFRR